MHTQQIWDERADEWENELTYDAEKIESTRQRVDATAKFLRKHGLLKNTDDVIDIGCGPGRFVAEFAKTAHSATGSDISGRMLEHGAAFARSQGLSNTSYVRADFNDVDLDELGWRHRFDLVFTSITPAVGGSSNLWKLMEMSRGFCFNSCFVHSDDDLVNGFLTQELKQTPQDQVSGHWHWFYGLFNLLLLEGYFPETTYFDEKRSETIAVTPEAAQHLCGRIMPPDGMSCGQLSELLYKYMLTKADAEGVVVRNSICTYGWILWDVRRHVAR